MASCAAVSGSAIQPTTRDRCLDIAWTMVSENDRGISAAMPRADDGLGRLGNPRYGVLLHIWSRRSGQLIEAVLPLAFCPLERH
jgi:hypothetical protein